MTVPTAAQLRASSDVDFGDLGYPDDPRLQALIDRLATWMLWATGQSSWATLDPAYDGIAYLAFERIVELTVMRKQVEQVETLADFDLLASFSVTGYSETRRGLDDIRKMRMIFPDPTLHSYLWAFATPDRRSEWDAYWSGVAQPAFEVVEYNWAGTSDSRSWSWNDPWQSVP